MPRSKKKATEKTLTPREAKLLQDLEDALSDEERTRAFAGALLSLDDAGRKRLLDRLGPDTARVLVPLFTGKPGKRSKGPAAPVTAGKAKTRQDWDGLWAEWEERLCEAGTEDGEYVHQEHHWEEPSFDADGVASDLDAIAKRVRTLLPRVWDEGLDPSFSFAEQLLHADYEVGSGLPEWIHFEDFSFGGETTLGFLEWEWRVAQRDGLGPYEFVAHVREVERSFERAGLDGQAIARFLLGLPVEAQNGIFVGMSDRRQSEEWKTDLGRPHSVWFDLFRRWAKRWAPKTFDEASRANVAKDWTLALPLLSNHLRRKQFAEARALALQAVHVLLRLGSDEAFDPRRKLLVRRLGSWRFHEADEKAFRVLDAWQKACAALGERDYADALALQCAVGPRWQDADAVLAAFAAAGTVDEALFTEWRSMIVEASLGWGSGERYSGDWVASLVDSARAGDGGIGFERAVRAFLASFGRSKPGEERPTAALATLSFDLDHEGTFSRKHPKLASLLRRLARPEDPLARWRRRLVRRWNQPGLAEAVIETIRSNLAAFVPDPRSATSAHYEDCARWAAAVREFDSQAYSSLMAEWNKAHHRRRNLWSALRKAGLGDPSA